MKLIYSSHNICFAGGNIIVYFDIMRLGLKDLSVIGKPKAKSSYDDTLGVYCFSNCHFYSSCFQVRYLHPHYHNYWPLPYCFFIQFGLKRILLGNVVVASIATL